MFDDMTNESGRHTGRSYHQVETNRTVLSGTTRLHVCDPGTGFPCRCVNNRGGFESHIASYANQTIRRDMCVLVALAIGSLIRLL